MIAEAQSAALEMPLALEMVGLIVGTMGGTLTACERKLDLIGGVALGMACGLGGGLVRDVIMQEGDVYLLSSPFGIPVSVGVAVLVFFFHGTVEGRTRVIEWLDILAVAIFATVGADKAVVYGLSPLAVLLMGVLTGNGGGVMRDIMLGDVPKLFQKSNWYAICSLGGSLAYWALVVPAGISKGAAAAVSVLVTIGLRRLSLRFDLQSPADVDLTPQVREGINRVRRPRRNRHTSSKR